MNSSRDASTARISEEATAWFMSIRAGELSATEEKRFAHWLAESPVHVREYLGISATWGGLQMAQSWPDVSSDELLHALRTQASNVIPLTAGAVGDAPAKPALPRPRHRRMALLAAAASLLFAVLAGAWLALNARGEGYHTARSEQRTVALPDGSVLQLNTLTRVVVHFDAQRRLIELPEGEAFFRVAHDSEQTLRCGDAIRTGAGGWHGVQRLQSRRQHAHRRDRRTCAGRQRQCTLVRACRTGAKTVRGR